MTALEIIKKEIQQNNLYLRVAQRKLDEYRRERLPCNIHKTKLISEVIKIKYGIKKLQTVYAKVEQLSK